MRKEFCMFLAFISILLMYGCEENEMMSWQGENTITFITQDKYGKDNEDPEALLWERNWGIDTRGILFVSDTLDIWVKAQGDLSDKPRKIAFKTEGDPENVRFEFPEKYILPAGEYRLKCKVVIARPVDYDSIFTGRLMFDYENCDFLPGSKERQAMTFKNSDVVTMELLGTSEREWNSLVSALGKWSSTKGRFMLTVLKRVEILKGITRGELTLIKNALAAYKDNPDNPPLYDETQFPEKVWINFP